MLVGWVGNPNKACLLRVFLASLSIIPPPPSEMGGLWSIIRGRSFENFVVSTNTKRWRAGEGWLLESLSLRKKKSWFLYPNLRREFRNRNYCGWQSCVGGTLDMSVIIYQMRTITYETERERSIVILLLLPLQSPLYSGAAWKVKCSVLPGDGVFTGFPVGSFHHLNRFLPLVETVTTIPSLSVSWALWWLANLRVELWNAPVLGVVFWAELLPVSLLLV